MAEPYWMQLLELVYQLRAHVQALIFTKNWVLHVLLKYVETARQLIHYYKLKRFLPFIYSLLYDSEVKSLVGLAIFEFLINKWKDLNLIRWVVLHHFNHFRSLILLRWLNDTVKDGAKYSLANLVFDHVGLSAAKTLHCLVLQVFHLKYKSIIILIKKYRTQTLRIKLLL